MSQFGEHSKVVNRPEERLARRLNPLFLEFIKRGFDVAVAITGLLLLSPLIFLILPGIMIESLGPILCRHKRYGFNNAEFEIFEFQTTLGGQEENNLSHRPNKGQSVTRFGQILLSSHLDKIPRLVNVLRGEMSIVGTHLYTTAPGKAFPLCQQHNVKPGLISWAQVNDDRWESANTAIGFGGRINCDRYYLENRSFLLDIRILLRTLLSKSTYL
jgi:lipopolysaccharide/colanic/teichoic acid biosynthesis glycosyltransferase